MPRKLILVIVIAGILSSCSPRDFLTRRLAADLIASSNTFRSPQQFQFDIGVIANDEYTSQPYVTMQHRGWISGSKVACPPSFSPAPCWNVTLTPSGVDTLQTLVAPSGTEKQSFIIPAARREMVSVTGMAKQGDLADVEFIWKWVPLNEVGATIYGSDLRYRSNARFRCYDDGWRLVDRVSPVVSLDQELKNAETLR
jgi:hypothetical protein